MSKRILVAVDLSDASIDVLREGRALATARGATLAVVYVAANFADMQPFYPQSYGTNMTHALEAEEIARETFERRVAEVEGCADIERFFERGTAYAEIVRRAEHWAADLVMVGSHGRSGLSRALLGSVAGRVARHAHCAVLVSRRSRSSGVVLAATDLSDPSLPAVGQAVAEARLRGARLVVAHVIDNTLAVYGAKVGAMLGNTVPLPSVEAQREAKGALAGLLQEAVERFGGEGEPLVLDGDVVAAIVHAVDERQADLLVVGTHGRTGLSRILLGSIAERLLQLADCSVLVVRQAAPA